MRGSKWSACATKNSVITAPTAKSELIFGFSDIIIGEGGYQVTHLGAQIGGLQYRLKGVQSLDAARFRKCPAGKKKTAGQKLKGLWLYILLACSKSLDAGWKRGYRSFYGPFELPVWKRLFSENRGKVR